MILGAMITEIITTVMRETWMVENVQAQLVAYCDWFLPCSYSGTLASQISEQQRKKWLQSANDDGDDNNIIVRIKDDDSATWQSCNGSLPEIPSDQQMVHKYFISPT